MFPRVRPPASSFCMTDRICVSCQGMRGPPMATWFTPSCLIRRKPASSNVPAESEPAPTSRHNLGVCRPSFFTTDPFCSSARTSERASAPMPTFLIAERRDHEWYMLDLPAQVRPETAHPLILDGRHRGKLVSAMAEGSVTPTTGSDQPPSV